MNELDNDQQNALQHDNALILASPGSGKTRTLVEKAIYEHDMNRTVYVITFTVSAAEEVQRRIEQDGRYTYGWGEDINVSTLHSMCLDIMRESNISLELADGRMMEDLAQGVQDSLRLQISNKRIAELLSGADPAKHKEQVFCDAIDKQMRENGLVSYEGMLKMGLWCLKQAGSEHRKGPEVVYLIDEAQDSAPLDLQIYDVLVESGARLWMVGDMQQAIFGFRHPQKVNVWDWWHERMLDYAAWVELPINYRSSQAVVAALNKINTAFIPRVGGKAVPGAPQGSVTCTTGRSEAAMFTAMATKAAGWADDVAILCRTNEQAGAVARFLEGEGMSVKKRRKDAPERVPARLWAALSLYIKPESDWRASRLLKLDRLDEVEELSNRAAKEMKPLVSYLYPDLLNAGKQREAWPQWMDILGVPKSEQAWFYERVGEHWQEMTWDRVLLRLFEAVANTEEGMGITVITIHAAKGREWRHVMVPFCDDKTFRSDQEEERIFFVGASRAISDLAFFYAETLFDPWTNQRVPVNICKSLKTLLALDSERDTVRPLPENPTAKRTKKPKKENGISKSENSDSSPKNLLKGTPGQHSGGQGNP